MLPFCEALGPGLDLGFEVEGVLSCLGEVLEGLPVGALLLGREPATQLRQGHCQDEKRCELGCECLGRGHTYLGPGAGVERESGAAWDGALAHVADGEGLVMAQRLR